MAAALAPLPPLPPRMRRSCSAAWPTCRSCCARQHRSRWPLGRAALLAAHRRPQRCCPWHVTRRSVCGRGSSQRRRPWCCASSLNAWAPRKQEGSGWVVDHLRPSSQLGVETWGPGLPTAAQLTSRRASLLPRNYAATSALLLLQLHQAGPVHRLLPHPLPRGVCAGVPKVPGRHRTGALRGHPVRGQGCWVAYTGWVAYVGWRCPKPLFFAHVGRSSLTPPLLQPLPLPPPPPPHVGHNCRLRVLQEDD